MTPDPTRPLPPSEPVTQAHPSTDPWAVAPPSAAYPTAPATAQFPDPPAAQFSAPPATPYPAPPAGPYPAPPVTAQFWAPPATDPFSAPPAAAPYPTPPATGPYPTPPAAAVARPGPHPPVLAPMPAHPAVLPAGFDPAAQGVVAVQIGEIMVTPPVIRTPVGVLPLTGASWQVADYWQKEEKIAPWALVCAVLGFFCLTFFSLLFLLVKETRHHGTVQVTVTNGARQYVARIPVSDQGQVQHINNQVNYARALSLG